MMFMVYLKISNFFYKKYLILILNKLKFQNKNIYLYLNQIYYILKNFKILENNYNI